MKLSIITNCYAISSHPSLIQAIKLGKLRRAQQDTRNEKSFDQQRSLKFCNIGEMAEWSKALAC